MFSLIRIGMCCRPLCTAIVRPTISGRIIERREQVLIGRLLLVSMGASTFAGRWWSTNGPFLIERGMTIPDYLFLRGREIYFDVRLFVRVRLPLVLMPHGVTGWRPLVLRPSPPPWG